MGLSGWVYLDGIIWMGLSGWDYMDGIIWMGLSGWDYMDGIIWMGLSGWDYLDGIIWMGLSGWDYPDGGSFCSLLLTFVRFSPSLLFILFPPKLPFSFTFDHLTSARIPVFSLLFTFFHFAPLSFCHNYRFLPVSHFFALTCVHFLSSQFLSLVLTFFLSLLLTFSPLELSFSFTFSHLCSLLSLTFVQFCSLTLTFCLTFAHFLSHFGSISRLQERVAVLEKVADLQEKRKQFPKAVLTWQTCVSLVKAASEAESGQSRDGLNEMTARLLKRQAKAHKVEGDLEEVNFAPLFCKLYTTKYILK
jgi:hypothetical protein